MKRNTLFSLLLEGALGAILITAIFMFIFTQYKFYIVATISGVIGIFCMVVFCFGSGFGSKVNVLNMAVGCLLFSFLFYQFGKSYQAKLEEVNPATEIIDSVIDRSEK